MRLRWSILLLLPLGLLVGNSGILAQNKKPYPPTKLVDVAEKLHGVVVSDPYRWLEDGTSSEVKAWTQKQNAYAHSVQDKLRGRDRIKKRLEELLATGIALPHVVKGRRFYTELDGKRNQPVLFVEDGPGVAKRILLDPNLLSKDGTIALDWWYVSWDGKLLAYGISENGSEKSTLHVRDVATAKDLPDSIQWTGNASVAWTPDHKGFYYTRFPRPGSLPLGEENYHRHVYYHALGSDPATDSEIFGAGRPKEDWPGLDLSPDGRWLLIAVWREGKSDIYLKDLKTRGPCVPVVEKAGDIYDPTLHDNVLYMRTSGGAPRYRVFKVDPAKPARPNWVEIIKEDSDVLENLYAIGDKLLALYLHNASTRLALFTREGKFLHNVALPALGSIEELDGEWDGKELFYKFSTFTAAAAIYHLDLQSCQSKLRKETEAVFPRNGYEAKQVKYASKDGTPITMFLVHRKGLKLDGNNPTLLTGYGGFGVSTTPSYLDDKVLLLERGGVIALPNLRGGGEYGEAWHQAGMLEKKQNVFDDFLAAAQWLIDNKYTNPRRLAIQGSSNGGLLMGAAVTQRPDLFRVAVCQDPLLDMLRYHRFQTARIWMAEYGNPDEPRAFRWLRAYSPYHHVKDGTAYPAMLISAGEADTNVDPMHARKMAARLQSATSVDQPILLSLEAKAGHGPGKPWTKALDELTDVWSFMLWQLAVEVAK